jgi:hypothetical protein
MWLASLVSQRADRPCGRVAEAARRELSTHRSGEGCRRWRWCVVWLASLVRQTGDRPCGRVAAAARRELLTHWSGEEVCRRGRWCNRRCLVIAATRDGSDRDDRGEFVPAAGLAASGREAVEANLGMRGRVNCLAKGVSDWRLS